MKKINVEDIQQRVSEVKALFVLGQKIMPVLEDIFQFIVEMQPVLDDINSSIKESSSKMPKAADKIINISNATELATSEILDHVDEIFKVVENMSADSAKTIENESVLFKRLVVDLKNLKTKYSQPDEVDKILSTVKKIYNQTLAKTVIEKSQNELEKINILANKILMALQFQDITSQQLQAANYLISQVQNKLGNLLAKLNDVDVEETVIDPQEFNENAEFVHNAEKQEMADKLLEEMEMANKAAPQVEGPDNEASPEDVDDIINQLENQNLDLSNKSGDDAE